MHPNTFLNSFWRLELRPQVFVAMSFAPQYDDRFNNVISKAINNINIKGVQLIPYRVDISKTGDSILTDISDGIAHSRFILADISTIGKDSVTGEPYRNSNVMYEVGIALASRQPCDILLIRDDKANLLFDVSTIPHLTIDFTDKPNAIKILTNSMVERLKEQTHIYNAKLKMTVDSLSGEEIILLKQNKDYKESHVWGKPVDGISSWYSTATTRLLDKNIIKLAGQFPEDKPAFQFTPLGFYIMKLINSKLTTYKPDIIEEKPKDTNPVSSDNKSSDVPPPNA